MDQFSLISVCIPCYNCSNYLHVTLTALLNQSYSNLEIIIIDDNSTDNSIEIIQEFAKKDSRIVFEIARKKGASAARNQAYQLSKGDQIIFFDADDWIPSNFIETQIKCLKSNREIVASKWIRFYNDDLSNINPTFQIQADFTFEEWIIHYWTSVSHMTCPGRFLIPKILIEESGLWDEDLSLNDDFSFFTSIFSKSNLIHFNGNTLFYYRSGINGLSALKSKSGYYSFYNSLLKGVKIAEEKFPNHEKIQLGCANLLQNFIYEIYPYQPDLLAAANAKIKSLGGADFKFPVGGKTRFLSKIIGWKLTKRLKIIFDIK
ncbi:glycosyltransferase family 2 protein [Pedobacter sp. Du54]|uniref:glycosyltransferase family 2 protein n=1 Tax=Pedobacter anseongensis TaxID=3133439 RepID=UPI00309AF025